ncbi:hypothetical protein QYE76_060545 [Lolium multiflorum]|uniref:F-box domain-containing protein n=1 Tax=Lolium multiflorum TaxID=4521 RepID=A0AAD8W5H3_LOLMU|nr:hypothetical protein QYE76_060545 [Lolium multiflorum]
MAAPPVLPVDLVEEILLRLPPDEPALLLRASLVCKAWSRAVSHPSFRRRLPELHGTAPVLGFLHNWSDKRIPYFVPTTASAFSLAAPDRRFWRALDCRDGRAFFVTEPKNCETRGLLMWEPVTGAQQRVPVPAAFWDMDADMLMYPSAAVFCAAAGCDHHGCHGGPFGVAFVFTVDPHNDDHEEYVTSGCVYSSETGTWGELTPMHCEFGMEFGDFSCVLGGRSLVYFMSNGMAILEYNFERNELAVIDTPDTPDYREIFSLMLAEDGGLGVIQDLDSHLKLWSREASDNTDQQWVLSRVIDLGNLLPVEALVNATISLFVLGFAEGADVIFVDTVVGLFTVELLCQRVRKVCGKNGFRQLIPVVDFYTPNEHQDQLLWDASEEERGEEE